MVGSVHSWSFVYSRLHTTSISVKFYEIAYNVDYFHMIGEHTDYAAEYIHQNSQLSTGNIGNRVINFSLQ